MGGIGSSSENIKKTMLESGLSSGIAGIRQKAEAGTGNYSFKSATAVTFKEAQDLKNTVVHKRKENTLIEGYTDNGKHVFYANKSESPEIKLLLEKRKVDHDTTLRNAEMTGRTTTTYDRWRKSNHKKFDEWYGVPPDEKISVFLSQRRLHKIQL